MEFSRVIVKPLLTEKSYALNSGTPKQYAFEVHVKASKYEISDAFQVIYDIKPTKVNTQLRKPTKVKKGSARSGYSKLCKIAYITLPKGKDISISSEQLEATKAPTPKKDVTKIVKAKEKGILTEIAPKIEVKTETETKIKTETKPKVSLKTKPKTKKEGGK